MCWCNIVPQGDNRKRTGLGRSRRCCQTSSDEQLNKWANWFSEILNHGLLNTKPWQTSWEFRYIPSSLDKKAGKSEADIARR
jgi:hypothetical protein